jgi:hypothetical protein
MEITFLIILACLVYTLLTYSKEGDILTFKNGNPTPAELMKKFKSKSDVMNRLNDLLVYKESYVRWNKYMVVAIFCSIIILYFLTDTIKIPQLIILSCFIFMAIDLPSRWATSHVSYGVIQEATKLTALHEALPC